jgi:serine O-acetyltransferase
MNTVNVGNHSQSLGIPPGLEDSIERLTRSILTDARTHHISTAWLPHRDAIANILARLRWLMFPGFFGPRDLSRRTMEIHVASVLNGISRDLLEQVSGALRYERNVAGRSADFDRQCEECDARALQIVDAFLGKLPDIRASLSLDVQAAYDGDPAAQHLDETIFCYPGLRAIAAYRLAHELYRLEVPLLPRIMSEVAHSVTGVEIHPGARIGRYFFIDHGTGVVIGETTVIGDHCKLYQGVTLGAKSFPKDERGRLKRDVQRHPTLEDYVTVYAGATILGGDTIIGAGSVINGGVFLTESVPPGHVVHGTKIELSVRSNPEMPPGVYTI